MSTPTDKTKALIEACPNPLYLTWKLLVSIYGSKIAVYDAIIDELMPPEYLENAMELASSNLLMARAMSRLIRAVESTKKTK